MNMKLYGGLKMGNEELKKKLWSMVDERKNDLLNLCSQLIKTPSENPPCKSEAITELICKHLKSCNIEYKIVKPDENTPIIVSKMGKGEGKVLIVNGHSDVVPVGDISKWKFDPHCGTITDTQILGRGASDMKAGLGAALFAVGLLSSEKINMKGALNLHVVPDEEANEKSTEWLVENGYAAGADAVLIAEPTSYNNCEVGQKGSFWVDIKSYGKSAHGSIGNYVGENAILKLIKLLTALDEIRTMRGCYTERQKKVLADSKTIAKWSLKAEGVENVIDHVTVNIGTINGGTKTNMVADFCEARVDIRTPIGVKTSDVIERIKSIQKRLGISGIEYDYPKDSEANYTDVDTDIVKSVVANAEEIWNKKVTPAYQWASSDAKFYRYAGVPTIQYGPANTEGIHSYNENVDIEDVVNACKVYLGIMVDLLELS